ncbi:MAG: hypothetical protein DHS20C15_29890 [Planctomycetota bacterium]|nr:MAG: hypothetical protein DHS20C15_29890 [Planctomycetota bacterium]
MLLAGAWLVACGDSSEQATEPRASESAGPADSGRVSSETANSAAAGVPTTSSSANEVPQVAAARGANLLFVTVDTLRGDRLGCYGWEPARTPVLDALAARGARALRALSATPVTLPSHTSLLTGLHPFRHGVRDNGVFRAGPELLTLAERLSAQRYRTAAFVSAHVLAAHYGLSQGFAHYDDRFGVNQRGSLLERPGDRTVDRLLEWWTTTPPRPAQPWFAWLHLFDPHAPYSPPAHLQSGFETSTSERYDAEIAFVDEQLGRVFEALRARGELERTLVVVTSDHGESLGEHHELTHGLFVYDATQHVPLIVAGPGVRAQQTISTQLAAVDVLPTLLELLGCPEAAALDGTSFAQALTSAGVAPGEDTSTSARSALAYLECQSAYYSLGAAPLAALSSATHKYVEAPRPELYDLRVDPDELNNLFSNTHPEARALAAALDALRRAAPSDASATPATSATPAADELARLAELGYLFAELDAGAELVDPKDIAQRSNELRGRVAYLLARRDYLNVKPVLEELLELLPGDVTAQAAMGKTLRFLGEHERAEEVLRALLRQRDDQPDAAIDLAHVMRLSARPQEALDAYELALAAAPRHPVALLEAAQIAFEIGRADLAVSYGERALASGGLRPEQEAQTRATVAALRAAQR